MKLFLPLLLVACILLVGTAFGTRTKFLQTRRKPDIEQVDYVARLIGVDRKKFGDYIHAEKFGPDYSFQELIELAEECKANGSC